MPCWVAVYQRIVITIRIQIQAQWVVQLSTVGVLLHESCNHWVVHSAIEVVQSALIVLISCITEWVVCGSCCCLWYAKGIVGVFSCDVALRCDELGYIGMAVV